MLGRLVMVAGLAAMSHAVASSLDAQILEAAELAATARRHAEALEATHAELLSQKAFAAASSGMEGSNMAQSATEAAAAAEAAVDAATRANAGWRLGNGHDVGQNHGRWYMEKGAWNFGSGDKQVECAMCVTVVSRLIQRLGDQFSRATIASESDLLCPRLGYVYRSGCDYVARQNRDVVSDLIMKLIEPVDICKHLAMCYPDAWDLAHMVGMRPASGAVGGPTRSFTRVGGLDAPQYRADGSAYGEAGSAAGYVAMRKAGLAPPGFPSVRRRCSHSYSQGQREQLGRRVPRGLALLPLMQMLAGSAECAFDPSPPQWLRCTHAAEARLPSRLSCSTSFLSAFHRVCRAAHQSYLLARLQPFGSDLDLYAHGGAEGMAAADSAAAKKVEEAAPKKADTKPAAAAADEKKKGGEGAAKAEPAAADKPAAAAPAAE